MEIIYNHYLGENITSFIENEIVPKLDDSDSNDDYSTDEPEGLIDVTEHITEEDFEGGKSLILNHVQSLGYEEDNDSWRDDSILKISYTIEWDKETIKIRYNLITFYLLSETSQVEWSIPENFTYYVEDIFSQEGFILKEKIQ